MPTMNPGYRDRRMAVVRTMPGRSALPFRPMAHGGARHVYRLSPAVFGAAALSLMIWAALIELFI